MITPRRGGYDSDSQARGLHDDDIPWYSLIQPDIPITNGRNLGSPSLPYNHSVYGLFPAQTCINASNESRRTVWKPGAASGIMEHLHLDVGELAPLVRIALNSQNFPRREGAATPEPGASSPAPSTGANFIISPNPTCNILESEPTQSSIPGTLSDFERINNVITNGVPRRTRSYQREGVTLGFDNPGFNTTSFQTEVEDYTPTPVDSTVEQTPVQFAPRGKIDNPYMKIDFLNPAKSGK